MQRSLSPEAAHETNVFIILLHTSVKVASSMHWYETIVFLVYDDIGDSDTLEKDKYDIRRRSFHYV